MYCATFKYFKWPFAPPQHICLLQPPILRSEIVKKAGSKHTFRPISRSTVLTTSSGVWFQCCRTSLKLLQSFVLKHLIPLTLIILSVYMHVYMYFRYLDSCTGSALKRKSESHSLATSSSSSSTTEEDKPAGVTDTAQASSDGINTHRRTEHEFWSFGSNSAIFFTKAAVTDLYLVSLSSCGVGQWGVSGPYSCGCSRSTSDRHHNVH